MDQSSRLQVAAWMKQAATFYSFRETVWLSALALWDLFMTGMTPKEREDYAQFIAPLAAVAALSLAGKVDDNRRPPPMSDLQVFVPWVGVTFTNGEIAEMEGEILRVAEWRVLRVTGADFADALVASVAGAVGMSAPSAELLRAAWSATAWSAVGAGLDLAFLPSTLAAGVLLCTVDHAASRGVEGAPSPIDVREALMHLGVVDASLVECMRQVAWLSEQRPDRLCTASPTSPRKRGRSPSMETATPVATQRFAVSAGTRRTEELAGASPTHGASSGALTRLVGDAVAVPPRPLSAGAPRKVHVYQGEDDDRADGLPRLSA
ncbi:unnamed protein product [Pedinophyceae sp. YPF-701]|nr:unnamed protein product [Pedinophyceae sp. YPF-701]